MFKNFSSISIKNRLYPKHLKHIHNPPQKLFYSGDIQLLSKTCISIVGTRKHSDYGEYLTVKAIQELSKFDVVIVSGLAAGIDTIAHTEALKNGLPTIAVLGADLENIYPSKNRDLSESISKNGLLLSEFENSPPRPQNFPQRNRVISGLSLATIVIEAPEKSGSMITANFALEQGRDIFTFPADIDRESFHGNRLLIRDSKAQPLASVSDISSMLFGKLNARQNEKTFSTQVPLNLSPTQSKILNLLNQNRGVSLEFLQQKTGFSTPKLLSELAYLEIYEFIKVKNERYLKAIP